MDFLRVLDFVFAIRNTYDRWKMTLVTDKESSLMDSLTISSKNTGGTSIRDIEKLLVDLPEGELHDALRKMADTLHSGQDVIIAAEQDELTPAQAARILGVSRAHFYKILDSGVIPYRVVGARDRRIAMSDIKKYLDQTEELRRVNAKQAAHLRDLEAASLDEM